MGEAADGVEAVELARTLRPDVVVMDVSMPNLSGIEATRQIAAELPGVRVVGLSMHDDEEIAASMRDAGAVEFVTKGGPPDAAIAAIFAAAHAGGEAHMTPDGREARARACSRARRAGPPPRGSGGAPPASRRRPGRRP